MMVNEPDLTHMSGLLAPRSLSRKMHDTNLVGGRGSGPEEGGTHDWSFET